MKMLVDLALKRVVAWIRDNPDSPFSRFMLAERGPRQDVARMTRLERLKSALSYLFWGIFNLILLFAVPFAMLKLGVPEGNPVFLAVIFALTFSTGIGLLAGLYLIVRTIV